MSALPIETHTFQLKRINSVPMEDLSRAVPADILLTK